MRILVLVLLITSSGWSTGLGPGWHRVELRGTRQDVFGIPARGSDVTILFLPGDGGWRGAAKEMAEAMAGSGYDVYVWDTKRYLSGFSKGNRSLAECELGPDFASVRSAVESDHRRPVILVGWSQGAAMSVVAAASPEGRRAFSGVVALALPEAGVLAWRRWDSVRSIWGGTPSGPHFSTEPYLPLLRPLPAAVIQAGRDRFTPLSVSKRLLARLHRPHHLRTLDDADHSFGPDRGALYRHLDDALGWIVDRIGACAPSCSSSRPPQPRAPTTVGSPSPISPTGTASAASM